MANLFSNFVPVANSGSGQSVLMPPQSIPAVTFGSVGDSVLISDLFSFEDTGSVRTFVSGTQVTWAPGGVGGALTFQRAANVLQDVRLTCIGEGVLLVEASFDSSGNEQNTGALAGACLDMPVGVNTLGGIDFSQPIEVKSTGEGPDGAVVQAKTVGVAG